MRKSWLLTAAAGCTVLLVAACGSGSTTSSGNGGGGDNGGGSGGGGGGGATIKIGTLHPRTGPYAGDGQQLENGVKLGIKAINDKGGIKALDGAKLALDAGDTKGSPETGQSEAQRLAQNGDVALIGTYQSAVAQNVAAVAERNKIPFLMDVASDDEILQQGYTYSFRVQPKGSLFAVQAAKYLKELNSGGSIKKIAYLHESSNFGTGLYKTFKTEAEKDGFTVGPEITYDAANVSDLTTQMQQVKASDAQALAVSGYYNDGVLAAKAIGAVRPSLKAVIGIADGAFDQTQFVSDAGKNAGNIFDVNYALGSSDEATSLAQEYQDTYNQPMRAEAGLAYDAVQAIAAAAEKAKSSDHDKVRDALRSVTVDSVMAGSATNFDEAGENGGALPVLKQVQDGKVVVVLPADKAEAKPTFPAAPGA